MRAVRTRDQPCLEDGCACDFFTAARRNGRSFVGNPAWATDALASSWDLMAEAVPAAWRPILESVKASPGNRLSGLVHEHGCGQYGCVFQTSDPEIVLKVTTDETEAEFAHQLSPTLTRPICVYYRSVISMNAEHGGNRIFLLWRESAAEVGNIGHVLGRAANDLINTQHAAAQSAYNAVWNGQPPEVIQTEITAWLLACEAMARQKVVPQLRELGDGLVEVYGQQRIFFGDIHAGNVGLVHRADGPHWVVTDPGHVAVVDL